MTIRNECQEYNLNHVNRSWKCRLYNILSRTSSPRGMYSMSTKNDPQVLIEDLWSELRSRGVPVVIEEITEVMHDSSRRISAQI